MATITASPSSVPSTPKLDDNDRKSIAASKPLIPIRATIQIKPTILAPAATAISPGPLPPPTPITSNGPASGTTTILPRPKPGRKPACDEPENKRKAQNRAAQRAFRERKLQGQQALEVENKELKSVNERLAQEIQGHRDREHTAQEKHTRLETDLTLSLRRESELRLQHERNLGAMAAFEQRTLEAESKVKEYYNEIKSLRDEVAVLTARINNTISQTPQAPIVQPPRRRLDGCGDCEENGSCPCVESFVDAGPIPGDDGRQSMTIGSILSSDDPARNGSLPDLISDHSSPEDMETDFTYSFKANNPPRAIPKADRCGFCEDGGKCICEEAEADIAIPLSQPAVDTVPITRTVKPGSCLQCQQNPEQKAYCESLARARNASRDQTDDEPAPKRSRISVNDVLVPCADAFALYKQYSTRRQTPSYDELYKDVDRRSHAPSNAPAPGFSAYEADMAAVMATMHQFPAKPSSGSRTRHHSRRVAHDHHRT